MRERSYAALISSAGCEPKSRAQGEPPLIAVAGAGGFIGRHLVRRLAAEDVTVRALMRHPASPIANQDVVQFDLAEAAVIDGAALHGIQVAYYLVHAMAEGPDFAALDREYARRFAAARKAQRSAR